MIISSERFIPHSLEHLIAVKAFPTPLPEEFYNKICKEYEAVDYAATQRIIYESDGLKVTGVTSFPIKTEAGKHPILIYNRGGTREYGILTVLSAMRSMIPFAKAGYLIYASNYRGNDGGEGIEEFGGADVNDIFNLLKIAKTNPAWDGRNIFMLGHSRGGLMTYMAVRNNKEINAAVSIAGVADIIQSAKERADMKEKIYQKLIPGTGNERKQAYINRSALCWADEIYTPLLLMHGTSDDAVDISHSLKLAEKLKEAGKTYEIIIYEGGNHALLRQWSNVLEKSLNWFERYRR